MHIVKTGSTGRRMLVFVATIAAMVGVSFWVPTHYHVTQQGIVIPDAFEAVASDVGGVVRSIHVSTGQFVQPGELVATLENERIRSELRVAEADRQQARVRFGAMAYVRGAPAGDGQAKLAQEIEMAEAGYELAATRARALELRAKQGGYVLTPNVEQLTGTYAAPNTPVVRLGTMRRIQLLIPLTENEAQLVSRGARVRGRWLANGRSFETELVAVSSQPAKPNEFHAGMLTYFGGAVPVQATSRQTSGRTDPVFIATAELDNPGRALLEGMRARLSIEGEKTTYGRRMWRWLYSLFSLRSGGHR